MLPSTFSSILGQNRVLHYFEDKLLLLSLLHPP